jgi:tRNA threonylcarbamoyladenosine biosynthesis protein TsaE
MTFTRHVHDVLETTHIGRVLGKSCLAGDVILLQGDLGAGKTTLTQSIAEGLEVSAGQYVTSPSFALMHEYNGRLPLYHMDFYRLSGEDDIEGAGLLEYIGSSGVAVIEWADRLGSLCPENRLAIDIKSTGETERLYTFSPYGSSWQHRLEKIFADQFKA